ncbi:hypothetical protein [Embleya scabrispora]|uniref:hypothetical protein n=1 Tax=Embleya scabrispora TaxID=159449 RepID=UPI001180E043|nr:hypothetical protein [Embleya scabrispora]
MDSIFHGFTKRGTEGLALPEDSTTGSDITDLKKTFASQVIPSTFFDRDLLIREVSGMSAIVELWKRQSLPIYDGLYYANGRSYDLAQDPSSPSGVTMGQAFDLDSLLRTAPDRVTSIDVTRVEQISEAEGYLCCGEGSYGSEGFFAKTDSAKQLLWVVYLENSNPFHEIEIREGMAIFRSTSGTCITAPIYLLGSGHVGPRLDPNHPHA